jgi:signal transduction histidine kinase
MRLPSIHLSRRGFLLLCVAGMLVPTVVLSVLGQHWVRRGYRFQSEILNEYGRFSVEYAADEITRLITEEQRAVAAYLQLASLLKDFDAGSELWRLEVTHPLIQTAYLLDTNGELHFARYEAAALQALGPEREFAAHVLRPTLAEPTGSHILISGEMRFYAGEENGDAYQFVALPLRDAEQQARGVGGFFLNESYVRGRLVPRALDSAIQAAKGRFAPDFGRTLTLAVTDASDRLVHAHKHADDPAAKCCAAKWLAQAELAEVLPGWNVGLTFATAEGFGMLRRVLGVQLTLLALATAALIFGTLFAMRFALRQMELVQLKSHFVSNITHELKTPLAAIRLYTETLQQGRVRDAGESNKFLDIIHKECVRLTTLVNNVLDFGRIESGRRRYTFAPAPVGTVVREVVDAYGYQLRDQGFELDLDVQTDLAPVVLDRDAVGQAVLNLLDNAVKYSRDRRHIEVAVHDDAVTTGAPAAASNGNGHIVIAVRDQGIGIPPGEQKRIFEPFYRVEKGLEHSVKGSGLGLAVVKHIAEAHGGTVTVDSKLEQGSTFTLRLPRGGPGAAAVEAFESGRTT